MSFYKKKVKPTRIFVDPSFKKKLKGESGYLGVSLLEYTRRLSGVKSLEEEFKSKKKDDMGFKYEF